jgi:hypothetical protein
MREGRLTQETIDQIHSYAPAQVAVEVIALRGEAAALGTAKANRRRVGALLARATVLSSRGDLATPIELRIKKPTRTAHRHRSLAEFHQVVDAHAGITAVMAYVERITGLTARWSGAFGLSPVSDAGSMGFDGSLRMARQYLEPIARLGQAAKTASRLAPIKTRRAQLTSREAGSVLMHEAFHAVSPYAYRDYDKAPGAEEGLAEILMGCFYDEMMRDVFGKPVAEAEPLDYPSYREPLERIANTLGVTRTNEAERAFYLGVLRRRSLAGRIGFLRRALVLAGVTTARAEQLVGDCVTAWKGQNGGTPNRTSTQRPPRRVKRPTTPVELSAEVA